MPRRLRVAIFLFITCWSYSPHAQELGKVESDLAAATEALHIAAQERKALEIRNAKLRKELDSLQGDLVAITSKVQQQEKLLSKLEADLLDIQDEQREKSNMLQRRRHELAAMVQTMLKFSRVPPEMVVAMPGDFETTMRTAKVLGLTTSALSQQAMKISVELAEIQELQKRIKRNYKQISQQTAILQKSESLLEAKLKARGTIQSKLLSRYEEQERQVKKLSDTSNTLKELMAQLEKSRTAREKTLLTLVPIAKPTLEAPTRQGKSALKEELTATKGKISLPAAGKIFIFYGDKKDNDKSRGISIRTRKGAKVIAPYAGEIVYTGTFLDYGNMVIVRHADGYHSLLAGMDIISAKLGQNVIKNEPIGEMGRNDEQTALYMEIRKNNRPIDPMPWLESQQYATKR